VIDLDPAFAQDLLQVAVGQTEAQIPAHRQQDHLSWEPVAGEGPSRELDQAAGSATLHPDSLAAATGQRNRAGDFEGVGDLFAADAEHFPPIGGRVVGREVIGAFYKSWAAPMGATIHPVRFVADDPDCVLEFEATTVDNPDEPRALSMEIFTVDEAGKITRMAIYRRPSNSPPDAAL
jgi:hypothetical protein